MDEIRRLIREVEDFPQPGVRFYDVTPVLADAAAFAAAIEHLAERYKGRVVDKVVAIESRGFILGAALALRLQRGLVLLRKAGKLPRPTFEAAYALEYGTSRLQIHRDALLPGEKALVIDDLLATGGTATAALQLVQRCGAQVVEIAVLIELLALGGRKALEPHSLYSLLTY